MKVSVKQAFLARALSIVSRAVSPRSTLPVLSNVLLATDEGRLRLSATNLELGITCWIGAKVSEEGSTTVPARTFTDLVGTLSGDEVDMALNVRTQTLNMRCGVSVTDLKCIDSQEFPPMPVADASQAVELNVADLKEMIHQVAFAASTDDARPVLTGVSVVINGNKLTMAAADGFRLSVRWAELSRPVARPVNAIIPARALNELARVAGDGKDVVRMFLPPGRSQVIFQLADIELVSQLIDGAFPPYEQIIPRRFDTRAVMASREFLNACKQAEIFARESSHIARLSIMTGSDMAPGVVEVTGQSEETGSSERRVDASIEGPALVIAFNVRFLREVLDVVKTPNVALETISSTSPGVIRQLGEDNFLHVIMPMHLGS